MGVSRLTDGLPITTEWLNSLVDEIARVGAAVTGTQSAESVADVIDVQGQFFKSTTRPIQILAERITGQASAGSGEYEHDIVFSPAFADNNVLVVATPSFVSESTTSGRGGRPFKASASVGAITSKGCKLTVTLVDDEQTFNKGKNVVVNYIAIGKRSS